MYQNMEDRHSEKMRKDDRTIILRPLEGKKTTGSTGLIDTRLFTNDNNLHAVLNKHTGLWGMKYEQGGLPQPLKQQFTSFNTLLKFVTSYYNKRNVEIVEILD